MHNAAADRDARIDYLTRKMEHMERGMEIYEDRMQAHELEVAEAIIQVRDTFFKVDEGMGEAAARLLKLDAGCDMFYKEFMERVQGITLELARLHKTDEDMYELVAKYGKTFEAQGRRLDSFEYDLKLLGGKAKLEPDSDNKVDADAAKEVYESMSERMTQIENKAEDMEKQLRKTSLRSQWPRGMGGKACGPFVCGDESCGSEGSDPHCSHCEPHEQRIAMVEAALANVQSFGSVQPPGFCDSSAGCAGHCAHVSQLLDDSAEHRRALAEHRRAIEEIHAAMAMAKSEREKFLQKTPEGAEMAGKYNPNGVTFVPGMDHASAAEGAGMSPTRQHQ